MSNTNLFVRQFEDGSYTTPQLLPDVYAGTSNYSSRSSMQVAADGWLHYIPAIPDDGCVITASHLERQGDAVVQVIDAQATLQEIAASEQQTKLSQAAAAYGGLIQAIQANLVVLGYSLPCNSAQVMSALIARSLAGDLSEQEKEAKSDLADLYIMLQGRGVSDDDLAAVYSYMIQQQ